MAEFFSDSGLSSDVAISAPSLQGIFLPGMDNPYMADGLGIVTPWGSGGTVRKYGSYGPSSAEDSKNTQLRDLSSFTSGGAGITYNLEGLVGPQGPPGRDGLPGITYMVGLGGNSNFMVALPDNLDQINNLGTAVDKLVYTSNYTTVTEIEDDILCTGSVDGNTLGTTAKYVWQTTTWSEVVVALTPSIEIVEGNLYVIKIQADGGGDGGWVYAVSEKPGSYTGGEVYKQEDEETEWVVHTSGSPPLNYDIWFNTGTDSYTFVPPTGFGQGQGVGVYHLGAVDYRKAMIFTATDSYTLSSITLTMARQQSHTYGNIIISISNVTPLYSEATWAETTITSAARSLIDDTTTAAQQTTLGLGTGDSPAFTGLTLSGLTASQFVLTNATKGLESLAVPLTVPYGGVGVATLTDHGILLGSGVGAITPLGAATNGQLPIGSTGADPVLAALTGTAKRVSVTNTAGAITLSGPQDLDTVDSPTFAGLKIANAGYIGSVSDTDAIQIEADGDIVLSQKLGIGITPVGTFHVAGGTGTEWVLERTDLPVNQKRFNVYLHWAGEGYPGYTCFRALNDVYTGGYNWLAARHDNQNVGIGYNCWPTAHLHITAGAAAADLAPLKFTAGVNLTTPEAGAMEFDGTNLYFTPAAARKTVVITDSSPTLAGLIVDTNTLIVDSTNHNVCINDASYAYRDLIVRASYDNSLSVVFRNLAGTSEGFTIGFDAGGNSCISTLDAAGIWKTRLDSGNPALILAEQAAVGGDVAGYGQIWVKNTTPNELWFTDDAGTDFQVGRSDGEIDHDALLNFIADEHVAHSGVTITAGTGMSGGGTIEATRTLDCTITQYTDALARTACIASSISDGDLTHAPDGNSVFDALALKAPIASPTFTGTVTMPSAEITSGLSYGLKVYADTPGSSIGFMTLDVVDNTGYLVHNNHYNGSWLANNNAVGSHQVAFLPTGGIEIKAQGSGDGEPPTVLILTPAAGLTSNSFAGAYSGKFYSSHATDNAILIGTSAAANDCLVVGFNPTSDYGFMGVAGEASTAALVIADGGNIGCGIIPVTKLTVEGTVTLKEQVAADADTAAYGQIWVKNDTPNTFWFTDDAGTDVQLGAVVTSLGSGCVAADHGAAATDQVINVCYGTGAEPDAATVTEGAIYIKYTA